MISIQPELFNKKLVKVFWIPFQIDQIPLTNIIVSKSHMKNLVLLAFLVAAIACLSLPTPIQPNPYVTTYTQACRYDMEQNLLNVNGRIVPRWYYTGRCYAGKSLETSCQYLQAIPQDYTNCVIQVSGNCQMTNGQFSPGSYENFVSHACCPPK